MKMSKFACILSTVFCCLNAAQKSDSVLHISLHSNDPVIEYLESIINGDFPCTSEDRVSPKKVSERRRGGDAQKKAKNTEWVSNATILGHFLYHNAFMPDVTEISRAQTEEESRKKQKRKK